MKVEPGAADLLAIAREAILREIAPALPESQRYAALMAARSPCENETQSWVRSS